MSMNVFGTEMSSDMRSWSGGQRRMASLVALGFAAALLVIGVVTWLFAKEAAEALYWVFVALVALALLFVVATLVLGMQREPKAKAHAEPHLGPGAPTPVAESSPSAARATLTLRCGDCGTVFDIHDTGERPLYHSCPGCGAEGVLRASPAAMGTPKPAPAPAPAPEPAPAPVARAHEPEPEPEAREVRRIKLRCGGCKQVFAIDDDGTRPLRHRCPHCSRLGEIR